MEKRLYISPHKLIRELQHEFREYYPFLNLEFYKLQDSDQHLLIRKHVVHSMMLKMAGLKGQGDIALEDSMTVASLEKEFREKFGLQVQVTRHSGIIWLETTMTDNWTLRQQNEHGREITNGVDKEKDLPGEYDLERDNAR